MPTIPPPWEEVESQFREVEPGGDMNQWRRRYNAMRDLALQRAANQGTSEGVGEFLSRRSIPFASAAYGAADTALIQGARQRISEGNHSHQDILDVADYENRNREQGVGMTALSGLAHIPAVVGEALAGGAAVRGLGIGATAATEGAGFVSNAARSVVSPMSWLRNATQTAAMPSMWLPEWTERNVQAGRNAFDPRALPSSYAMGFLNTAVLGSLSSPVGGAISGPGVYRSAARILATTGAGVLEQQGVDAFASAVSTVLPDVYKLNTGYGMVGSIIRGAKTGQWDEALKAGVSQLVTFGAFSVLHGASPKHVVEDIKSELDGLHESGATPRVAGEELIQRYNPDAIAQRAAPAPPIQEPGLPPQFQPRQPFQAPEQIPPQGPQPGLEPAVPGRPIAPTEPGTQQPPAFRPQEAPVTPPEPQQAQEPVQPPPEAPAGQPARPEPMPAAESRTPLRQILDRMDAGEKIPSGEILAQLVQSKELNDQQRRVLTERLQGRTLEDIGKNDLGVSRQRAKTIEKEALAAIGVETDAQAKSIAKLFKATEGAARAAKGVEEGHLVSPEDLHADPEESRRKMSERERHLRGLDDELTDINTEVEKILESDNPNHARLAELTGRADAIDREIRGLPPKDKGIPQGDTGAPGAAANLPAPAGQAPSPEGVNAPVRGTEHMTNAELDAAISRHYNKGGEDHLAEILMNEKQRRLGLGEIDPDTGNPVTFPDYPPGLAKLAEAGITPGREEQAPSIKRFMSLGSTPYEQAQHQATKQVMQQASIAEKAASMPQTPTTAQSATEWTLRTGRQIYDFFAELGGVQYPRMGRVDPETAHKMAKTANSADIVAKAVDYFHEAIGLHELSEEELHRFGAAWDEMRLRKEKAALAQEETRAWQEAQNAKARIDALASLLVTTRDQTERRSISTEMKRLGKLREAKIKESSDASNAGRDVISMIGRKDPRDGSVRLADEAAFQATINSPAFAEVHRRWSAPETGNFSGYADDLYRMAGGVGDNPEALPRNQIEGFVGSMRPITAEDVAQLKGGTSKGSLSNQKPKTPAALHRMTGASEYYETDLSKILQHTLANRVRNALLADTYRTGHENGSVLIGHSGQKLEGMKEIEQANLSPKKAALLKLPEGASLYVPEEAYGEWKSMLRVNDPLPRVPGASLLNDVTLTATQEPVSHGTTLVSALFEPRVIRYIWQTLPRMFSAEGKLDLKKRMFELAKEASTKPKGPETTTAFQSPWNPLHQFTKFTSKILDTADQVIRISLNEAYSDMARTGDVPDTPQDRRDFLARNALQYNKDSQNRIVQLLRETGLGSFATASTGAAMKAIRNLLFVPSMKTTSTASMVKLQAEKYAKVMVLLGASVGANIMMWGRWDGDDKTPVGAVKVGEDAQGNSMYVDLAALTGLRRGARLVGLNALMEGSRYGAGAGDIATKGATDFFRGVSAPFQGPIREFANVAMTGEDMRGTRVAPQSERGDWNSQALINIRTALIHANPIGEQIIPSIAGLDEVHPPSTTERIVTPLTGGLVKFRDQPQGQPSRPYLARSAEIDRLNDTISNLNAAKKKVEQNGDIFDHEAELRVLSQFSRQINQLEDVVRGGRIQRRLRPELRDARDREFEQIIKEMQNDIANQAMDVYRSFQE